MLDAAVSELSGYSVDFDFQSEVCARIYRAMEIARRHPNEDDGPHVL
jgi:hypothetical protein